MHGFALNVNTDVSYFSHIVPCGMPELNVSSVSLELGRRVEVLESARATGRLVAGTLGLRPEWMEAAEVRADL